MPRMKAQNDANYKRLCDCAESCRETADMIKLCLDSGVDLQPERDKNDEQAAVAKRLKSGLFPQRV